jgi:uncharacterized membrane protein
MTDRILIALLIVAIVGSGLIGGLFFIFSNTIMRAFDRLPAAAAVAAMQNINRIILNPLFFLAFFGTAAVCVALLLVSVPRLHLTSAVVACAGALIYLVGSIVVTMVWNVPLNNKLAAVSLTASDLAAQWQAYRVPWTMWNHVRTVACLLASTAFALTIIGR